MLYLFKESSRDRMIPPGRRQASRIRRNSNGHRRRKSKKKGRFQNSKRSPRRPSIFRRQYGEPLSLPTKCRFLNPMPFQKTIPLPKTPVIRKGNVRPKARTSRPIAERKKIPSRFRPGRPLGTRGNIPPHPRRSERWFRHSWRIRAKTRRDRSNFHRRSIRSIPRSKKTNRPKNGS